MALDERVTTDDIRGRHARAEERVSAVQAMNYLWRLGAS